MRRFVKAACHFFRRKKPVDKDNLQAVIFAEHACQYYTVARFAMYAHREFICATMFHHAIERALKGGLARKRDLDELKKMRHGLKVLWRTFKKDFADPDLDKHDATIAMVDKFEALRYPFTEGSIVIHLDWSQIPVMPTVTGGIRQPKHYPLVIAHVDELFADVFRKASWNPALAPPAILGSSEAVALQSAAEQVRVRHLASWRSNQSMSASGSFATFARFWHVRCSPKSDHTVDLQKSTLCAIRVIKANGFEAVQPVAKTCGPRLTDSGYDSDIRNRACGAGA